MTLPGQSRGPCSRRSASNSPEPPSSCFSETRRPDRAPPHTARVVAVGWRRLRSSREAQSGSALPFTPSASPSLTRRPVSLSLSESLC